MSYDTLLSMIADYGYAALFFALWLGIIGMPVPDEVVVMMGGAVTSSGLLHLVPAFLLTYLGVISGLSLGYLLGRSIGTPIIERLKRKKKMVKYLNISEQMIDRHGNFALVISYFFPVVRHVLPYIVGLNKMSFRRYALISYPTGFVWTLLFFTAGRLAGGHIEQAVSLMHTYGFKLLWLPFVLLMIFIVFRVARMNRSYNRIQQKQ
jgi:membrane-associated protein